MSFEAFFFSRSKSQPGISHCTESSYPPPQKATVSKPACPWVITSLWLAQGWHLHHHFQPLLVVSSSLHCQLLWSRDSSPSLYPLCQAQCTVSAPWKRGENPPPQSARPDLNCGSTSLCCWDLLRFFHSCCEQIIQPTLQGYCENLLRYCLAHSLPGRRKGAGQRKD